MRDNDKSIKTEAQNLAMYIITYVLWWLFADFRFLTATADLKGKEDFDEE